MKMRTIPQGMVIAAQSAEFWRRLAPGLTISDSFASPSAHQSVNTDRNVTERLASEGFAHFPMVGLEAPYQSIADAMHRIEQARLPAAFVAVYDEVWSLVAQAQGLVDGLLGGSACLVPDFWATFAKPGDAGLSAGRKRPGLGLNSDGGPNSLSVWIPITDANTENGCIYVVPGVHDRNYASPNPGRADAGLQAIRAIPANPGDMLVWTGETYTWQSRSSLFWKGAPQMSLTFEFQRSDQNPLEGYVVENFPYISFESRLALIAEQMPKYGANLLADQTWAALTQTLVNRFGNGHVQQSA